VAWVAEVLETETSPNGHPGQRLFSGDSLWVWKRKEGQSMKQQEIDA
jgi:hypothetical protein